MKFGIYYAYWEKEWGGNFLPYIKRVKDLGYDILERERSARIFQFGVICPMASDSDKA